MADLSPQEANQWFGGNVPTTEQQQSEANQYLGANRDSPDAFGYWWDTFVNGTTTGTQMLGASGAGPKPIRSGNEAYALAGSMGMNSDIRNAADLDAIARAGVAQGARANPYSTGIADQSRAAQLALIQQMRGQMNGPSIAAMQGQQAMGQSGQQALRMGAAGGPNARAAMLNSQQVGGGIAGDVARARLAEVMRAQAGIGGAAGNLRGADLQSATNQSRFGLAQQQQDEARRQMFAQMGLNLQNARDQAAANRNITRLQLLSRATKRDVDTVNQGIQNGASVFGMGMNMGGGSGGVGGSAGGSIGGKTGGSI